MDTRLASRTQNLLNRSDKLNREATQLATQLDTQADIQADTQADNQVGTQLDTQADNRLLKAMHLVILLNNQDIHCHTDLQYLTDSSNRSASTFKPWTTDKLATLTFHLQLPSCRFLQ
jgi:3'-phosphoadenosine 5'-phosphosulfate (PAPS) 3'-phosphatase